MSDISIMHRHTRDLHSHHSQQQQQQYQQQQSSSINNNNNRSLSNNNNNSSSAQHSITTKKRTKLYLQFKHVTWVGFGIALVLSLYYRVLSVDAMMVFPDLKRRFLFFGVRTLLCLIGIWMNYLSFKHYFQPTDYSTESWYYGQEWIIRLFLYYASVVNLIQYVADMTGYLPRYTWFTKLVTQPYSVLTMTTIMFVLIALPLIHVILHWILSIDHLPTSHKVKKLSFHILFIIAMMGLYHTTHPSDPNRLYANVYNDKQLLTLHHPLSIDQSAEIKVIQLSDIHLGGHMSVNQLHQIAQMVVQKHDDEMKRDPNSNVFILFTGDFYTFHSHMEIEGLKEGLAPLRRLKGKTFACLGNHDHEVLDYVISQLDDLGIQLLIDQSVSVPLNSDHQQFVEIVGFDFVQSFNDPGQQIQQLFHNKLYRKMDEEYAQRHVARLVLLHNPAYFQYIPYKNVQHNIPTFVFSGHLHSGQFSLRSFVGESWRAKFPATIVSLTTGWPDHGWFCFHTKSKTTTSPVVTRATPYKSDLCEPNMLLYAHGGTGFYGLPLRIGTENELPWVMNLHIQSHQQGSK